MEKDLRASVIAAVAAAALSALIGVIAGVGFLILLLRALALGLVVGAAVYGCIILLRNNVPEVLNPISEAQEPVDPSRQSAEDAGAAAIRADGAPSLGANLDIVLPGDEADVGLLAPGAEAFAPEPAAFHPRAAFSSAAPSAVEELDEASLLEPETGGEADTAIPANAALERDRRGVGIDDLDILPDLDGFSDSFTSSEFAAKSSSGERADSSVLSEGSSSARQGPASGMDPASLAQAVRTILKRDQKG